jgi:hypothetical protein
MLHAIKETLAKLRQNRLRTVVTAELILVAFFIATWLWTGRFSAAKHEIEFWFDVQAAPTVELHTFDDTPRTISTWQIQFANAASDWDIAIEAEGVKGRTSWGAEVWIQKITIDGIPVRWDKVILDEGWTKKDSPIGTDGHAFVSYGEGTRRTMHFKTHGKELAITYSRHQWTGLMKVTVNGNTREIDTWRESFAPETITCIAPPGPHDRTDGYISTFQSANDIGPSMRAKVSPVGGTVSIQRATFEKKPIHFYPDGTLVMPSRFTVVWMPAMGLALATLPAAALGAWMLWKLVRKAPLWCFAAIVVVAKLWMISGDEMRASPYDAHGYMLSSLGNFWDLGFSAHAYDRQPGYPLFISAARALGMPLRIWLELTYCAACLSIATALPRFKLPRWSAAAAFALMVFNPMTFPVMSFGYQDAAYAPFFLFFIGAMLHALPSSGRERLYACIATGVAAALVWNTRPEHILVVFMLAVFAVTIGALELARTRNVGRAALSATLAVAPPGLIVLALTLAICTMGMSSRMGTFSASNFQLDGFTSLYDELLAIEPEQPEVYHPIPTDVRLKAYAASPTFAQLKDALEGPALDIYRPLAEQGNYVRNDYGIFIFWGLRAAPWCINQWYNAAQLDRFYAKCAAELRAARERGDYKSRKVYAHFIDPRTDLWILYVSEGVSTYWHMLTRDDVEYLAPEPDKVDGTTFDDAALRRSALVWSNQTLWTSYLNPAIKSAKADCATVSHYVAWAADLLIVPVLALLAICLWRKPNDETRLLSALLIIVVCAFLSRLMLISVMHAVAFTAEPRYLMPIAPLPALVLAVIAALGVAALKRIYEKYR